MNLIFITMDGARIDNIIKGKNYQKLIQRSGLTTICIVGKQYPGCWVTMNTLGHSTLHQM